MKNVLCILIFLFLSIFSLTKTIYSQTNQDSIYLNLGVDIYLCDGSMHLLDAGPYFDAYLWQDSSTAQTFMVNEPGSFWVHAYIGSTMYADTISIGYWPNPDINFGNDTTICHGSTFMLQAPPGCISYLWMDGSSLPYYLVTEDGYYFVEVMDFHGCMDADTIFINYTTSVVELGSDTVICECGDPLILDAGEEFISYEWHDGSTSQYFEVNSEMFGIGSHYFSVNVIDSIGCESVDTILIYISECTLNVTQTKSEQISIYPNPAYEKINIDLQGLPNDNYSIAIYNSIGNVVFQNEMFKSKFKYKIKLDLSNFNSGIYFLKIISGKNVYPNTFLIQNQYSK